MLDNPRIIDPYRAVRIVILNGFSFDFVRRIAVGNELQNNLERLIKEECIEQDKNSEFEKYIWIREGSYATDKCNIIVIENDRNVFQYFHY